MALFRSMAARMSTKSDSASDSDSDDEREYDIRQARCEVHRRKIGIRLDKRLRAVGVDGGDTKQDDLVDFIRRTFSMKECIRYVPDPKASTKNLAASPPCHCGAAADQHWHSPNHKLSPGSTPRSADFGTLGSGQIPIPNTASPRNLILTPAVTQELMQQRKAARGESQKVHYVIDPLRNS